jgi:hypothetical protein
MKKLLCLIFVISSFSIFAEEGDDVLTVKCKGVLEKQSAYNGTALTADHTIKLQVERKDEKDPGFIDQNGKITFPEGYEVVYNINVQLGKGGLFSSTDTVSEIRARLQRHRGGNGKVVLGASSLTIKQKAEKKKSKIGMGIVNVRALNELVNEQGRFVDLANDPILFQTDFKEAVYTGTLDEGVVKSAQIECSTL